MLEVDAALTCVFPGFEPPKSRIQSALPRVNCLRTSIDGQRDASRAIARVMLAQVSAGHTGKEVELLEVSDIKRKSLRYCCVHLRKQARVQAAVVNRSVAVR